VPSLIVMDTLLVVEDEPSLRALLSDCLREPGYEVITAGEGREAVRLARRHAPDLIVLDVMLPDIDGFDVVRRLRGGGDRTPVLFLTARDATADKVRGLTAGGDDYVTKPFSLEELIARVQALLRRGRGAARGPVRLAVADLELDQDAHAVWRAGRPVSLSATEFQLLRYLMVNQNRVLSRTQILDHVWDPDFSGNPGIVEQYVSLLRRKVDSAGPRLIHTVRSVGYVLRVP
jgi:two-component system, OmpR family, response regulator